MANFDSFMIQSGFVTEGYFDNFNYDASVIKQETGSIVQRRKWGLTARNNIVRYEFAFFRPKRFFSSKPVVFQFKPVQVFFRPNNLFGCGKKPSVDHLEGRRRQGLRSGPKAENVKSKNWR